MTPAPPPVPSSAVPKAETTVPNEPLTHKYAELDALLARLKQEAANFSAKPEIPPHSEFEMLKTELYNRPTPHPLTVEPWKPLKDTSTFVPRPSSFAVAGQRLVQSRHISLATLDKQDYTSVESQEVRTQLGTLDGLLRFCHTNY